MTLNRQIICFLSLWGFLCSLYLAPAIANTEMTVQISDITDGDSLRAGSLRLRLFGIDAPELQQTCQSAEGEDYACGIVARNRMRDIVPIGTYLRCTHMDTDRYKRLIVACANQKGDIAEQLIAEGFAIAHRYYSKRYVPAELHARKNRLGLWAGTFQDPYEYRRAQRK